MVSLDVGGVVGIRVENARQRDLALLRGQLGLLNGPLGDRHPDIVIEYSPVGTPSDLRLIGQADAATGGGAFYLWSERRDLPTSLSLQPGLPLRIQVPSGARRIPILPQLVSAAAVQKGHLPLHASALTWRGRGALLAGWSKGGKSEALLSFMERGATYVGDEWLFLSSDDGSVGGIPEPIRIWDWHLTDLPRSRGRLQATTRLRFAALRAASAGLRRVATAADWHLGHRLGDLVEGRRWVRMDPSRLFGRQRCAHRASLDAVFLMVSCDSPEVRVRSVEQSSAARRIAASTVYEHLRLLEAELKREFAFPDGRTPLWDAVTEAGDALGKHLADLPVFEVTHPYPVPTRAVFDAMAPVLEAVDR